MDLSQWVQRLTPDQLPPVPWLLHPHIAVCDNTKFLIALQHDGEWRKQFGAFQKDAERLHEVVTTGKHQPAPWAGRFVTDQPAYRVEHKTKKRGRRAA